MHIKEVSNHPLLFSLSDYFCCDWSEDGKFFILNDEGIDIHTFKPNPESKHKCPEFERSFIASQTKNPSAHSGFQESDVIKLTKKDLFRALSNHSIVPSFSFNLTAPTNYNKASWSSKSILSSNKCLLAAISVLGSVNIWYYNLTWSVLLDVSELIRCDLKENKELRHIRNDSKEILNDTIYNANLLNSTAMAWSDVVHIDADKRYSYFATAQVSGQIYVWKLEPVETAHNVTMNSQLVLKYNCEMKGISEMHWITLSKSVSYLILGSKEGFVVCLQIEHENSTLKVIKTTNAWTERDNISVSKIISVQWDDNLYYIMVMKRSFVISFVLDDDGNVSKLDYRTYGNLNITGVYKINDKEIYMGTLTGIMYHLRIVPTENNSPSIMSSVITSDIRFEKYALHGFTLSRSHAFWIMILHPCKRTNRFHGKKWGKVWIGYIEEKNPINILQSEPNMLTDKWDCLELVRILKLNSMHSKLQISTLLDISNCESLYSIKLCYWLNIICKDNMKTETPATETIKCLFNKHAMHYSMKLVEKYKRDGDLTPSDSETLSLQYKLVQPTMNCEYFDILCSLLNISEREKCCEWCEEKLIYPFCSQNHVREFCCVTFRDVDSQNCLVCSVCNSVAHIDLWSTQPLCSLCDSPMYYLPLCANKNNDQYKVELSTQLTE